MGRNIEEIINSLTPERRKRIERRSAELLAEYKAMQERKQRKNSNPVDKSEGQGADSRPNA